jgi:hypothetical protein
MTINNRTPGQQVHDALVSAAEAKNDALIAERKAKRVYAQVYLAATGSVEERKQKAVDSDTYAEYEDKRIDMETKHNIARAEADGLQCRFNEWQTNNATRRAEMNLR